MSDAFTTWFSERFGAPSPLRPRSTLVPSQWAHHFWSEPHSELAPTTLVLPHFVDALPDYAASGVWGYGSNQHAYYWTERRGEHRTFFRLPYAGLYEDVEANKREIVRFLEGARDWQAAFESRLASSTLVHSMGRTTLEVRATPASLERHAHAHALPPEVDTAPTQANGGALGAPALWQWIAGQTARRLGDEPVDP